jgi:glycosyltransferase involved in cell wall biosynthesis
MKILFFIESLRAGGKERRIVELLKGLKKYDDLRIELVLTRNEIHYQEIYDLNIPIHIAKRRWLKKDPLVFFKFFNLAKKINPDIIHVWGHMVAVYAVPVKWLLKVPLINNEITDTTIHKKLIGRDLVFNASDRIIANTHAGLLAYKAPMAKSTVIHNGFNFDRLRNIEDAGVVRKRFGIETPFVVGMVATFSTYKDYGTYIRAALTVLEKRNDITFLCIGDGENRDYRQAIPEGRNKRILFLGKQDHVEPIMNCCDVGILTTNTKNHGEGISNALMEFMALGKPVITTNYGGSVELIEDHISGYLIKAFNHTQLADRIIHLLENKNECERMGKKAKERIEEKFGIDRMVNRFREEYKLLGPTTL